MNPIHSVYADDPDMVELVQEFAAEMPDRAMAIYERGEAWEQAAEIAAAIGEQERAGELFLRARNAPRAAEMLKAVGRDEEAARALAEYHRDRGEDEEARAHYHRAIEQAPGSLFAALAQKQLNPKARSSKAAAPRSEAKLTSRRKRRQRKKIDQSQK